MATFDLSPEARASTANFLKRQLFRSPPVVSRNDVDLAGKTAIVTGSNTGIGLECSCQLLGLGLSRLILAVRNEIKGEAAKKDLASGQVGETCIIEVWELNMSLYDSISKFVDRVKTLDRLDIVILNAGVAKLSLELNPHTGHEEVIQVNHLSTSLLAILLLPVFKDKNSPRQPGRLVIVSSDTAAWAAFKEKDSYPLLPAFDKPEFFNNQDRYATSRLVGQLFLSELAKRVPPTAAIINFPNPGMCYGTGLNKEADGTLLGVFLKISFRLLGRTSAVGARALTDAAVRHGDESHGQYLEDGKLNPLAPIAYTSRGERLAKIIWQETMDELEFAHVSDIIQELNR